MWCDSYDGNISNVHIMKNIESFCNEMNHKTFFKLFLDTIFHVIDLSINYSNKNQQPDDVISSKNNQESEKQGKDALYDLTKIHTSEKHIPKDVEGINNSDYKAEKKKYYHMMQLLTKVIKKQIKHKILKMI